MIQAGQTVVIKTTDEECFVIRVDEAVRFGLGLKAVATVRRPTVGRDGIIHHVDEFFLDELYTKDEQFDTKLKEQMTKAERANKFRVNLGGESNGVEAIN